MLMISDVELCDAVNAPDLMVRILRIHQYLDQLLSALVNEQLVESHYLDVDRIPFALRVELAVALGVVDKEDRSPLLQFNTFRNRFAHDPKTEITEKDLQDFYNLYQGKLRTMLNRDIEQYSTPAGLIGEMSVCLYIKLEHSLKHIRDSKLWNQVYAEETRDIVARARAMGRLSEHSEVQDRLKARFERLKAESSSSSVDKT